ncbi:MAG: carbohydrate-binding protein [Paludibacteraceae bacterium]|nr:carbohydrate-binding protein [Paludibacteraceae bacterium]
MNKSKLLVFAFLCNVASYAADFNLKVNLGDSIRPVTHVATGSLYGLTETLPADIGEHVKPLKPNVFLNPAAAGNGRQQPIGDAFKAAERLKGTTGKVHIRLADLLPGWPYGWKGWAYWESEVKNIINKRKTCGLDNLDGYEIWNEPYGTWKDQNGRYHEDLWKPTYDLLRRYDPNMRIIGPSFAFYSSQRMENFVKFCKENNCMPDIISWHQWGSDGFVGALEHYRSLERKYGISPRKISINEYSSTTHELEGCPGVSVPFIAKFERHGVESAMISWWFTNLAGRLGSLLTAQNQKGGGWYLYKWYGDMDGYMAMVTPPNDKSDGVDGFAAVNKTMREASVVLGGSSIGTVHVDLQGIPEWMGNEVEIKVEYVTWENKDKAVPAPQTISREIYTVNGGRVSVPVNVTSGYYAYRLYITPAETVPQSPFLGIAHSIPGTIEAEQYDNGSEGISYHDSDRENRGGAYRKDSGVDVYALKGKADEYAVGYATAGEWLLYTVNVKKESLYKIDAILSSGGEASGIKLYMDDVAITGELRTSPNGEDWESYELASTESAFKLAEGEHTMRLEIVGSWINIDKLIFTEIETSDVTQVQSEEVREFTVFDMNGKKLCVVKSNLFLLPKALKERGARRGGFLAKSGDFSYKVMVE